SPLALTISSNSYAAGAKFLISVRKWPSRLRSSILLLPSVSRLVGKTRTRCRPPRRNSPNRYAQRKNMFHPSSIIVSPEVGTSKVCAVVGELSSEGALNMVGLGQAWPRGLPKGEIASARPAGADV